MKNLANCKPSEFLAQTVKIRHSVEGWLKATDIMNIRKMLPVFTEDMTIEDKRKAMKAQAQKNLIKIFDAAVDENAEKTLELLALLCFVEPEDVDDHPMSYYINAVIEMLQDESVISFFYIIDGLGQEEYFECVKEIRIDLLDMIGRMYVIDHCISTIKKKHREKAYKNYIADCMQLITENTAKYVSGRYINTKYSDIEAETNKPPKEEPKPEDIINRIKDKLINLDNQT